MRFIVDRKTGYPEVCRRQESAGWMARNGADIVSQGETVQKTFFDTGNVCLIPTEKRFAHQYAIQNNIPVDVTPEMLSALRKA